MIGHENKRLFHRQVAADETASLLLWHSIACFRGHVDHGFDRPLLPRSRQLGDGSAAAKIQLLQPKQPHNTDIAAKTLVTSMNSPQNE